MTIEMKDTEHDLLLVPKYHKMNVGNGIKLYRQLHIHELENIDDTFEVENINGVKCVFLLKFENEEEADLSIRSFQYAIEMLQEMELEEIKKTQESC